MSTCAHEPIQSIYFATLKYCAPMWKSSAKSHLGLLNSVVRSAERLCEGELCCFGSQKEGQFFVFAI